MRIEFLLYFLGKPTHVLIVKIQRQTGFFVAALLFYLHSLAIYIATVFSLHFDLFGHVNIGHSYTRSRQT